MSPEPRPPHGPATAQTPPAAPGNGGPGPATTGPAASAPDVIHNIGYRGYDGPRLGRGYARRSLFAQTLRGAYGLGRSAKSKVLPLLLFAVVCVPAVMVVAVAVFSNAKDLPLGHSAYVLQMQPLIGIFIASAAPQAVSLDLRFKTVPLYFSRPVERSDYVAAKFAALWAALFLFLAVPVVILYAGALLAQLDFADQTKGFGQGIVFCALFALLHAALALAVAAATPRRGFGIAAIIAVLTIPYMLVTALQGIALGQGSAGAAAWLGLASPGTLMDGVQSAFLGGSSGFPGGEGPGTAQGLVYLLLVVALIAGSYALLARRYRKAGL